MSEPAERPDERSIDEILALRAAGPDAWRIDLSGFGGETLGCAARAAALSCPDKSVHSLHAHFLRPLAGQGIDLEVERVRDGRRLAHRRVRGGLPERPGFEAMVVLGAERDGHAFQDVRVPEAFARPEDWPTDREQAETAGEEAFDGPFAMRWCGLPWDDPVPGRRAEYHCWVRPRHPLGDDPALEAGVLAYLSDYHSHLPLARQLGGGFDTFGFTSLDTSLWLHVALPWHDWRFLHSECDGATAGRALTRRRLFARDGRLVATMAQEALIPDEAALRAREADGGAAEGAATGATGEGGAA